MKTGLLLGGLIIIGALSVGIYNAVAVTDDRDDEPEFFTNNITNNTPSNITDDPANEITTTGDWINTNENLTLEKLKGKVVLIEFWTFGCYNCTNTIPHLNEWYGKYKDKGLEIIGIHCPEFDNERNPDNVRDNVKELGIEYPVLIDNEFKNWYNYDVHAWPTIFVLDKNGVERYKKVGEKGYKKTEAVINELLAEE
ncbi:MAG: redoxin domain-containing protein [Ignavibacteriae bacterium]|nr:redoxin domain-containing protein [Ignavibacteriota bacterium]MCB9242289.1 redoxin domain-containing protein [Ignavibacteriales bacterium]